MRQDAVPPCFPPPITNAVVFVSVPDRHDPATGSAPGSSAGPTGHLGSVVYTGGDEARAIESPASEGRRPSVTPEEIEAVDLRRARIGGYDRRSTDELLRQIAVEVRALLEERGLLEAEVRRLKETLIQRELTESGRVIEMQEAAKRECDLFLKKARRQAYKIRDRSAKETAGRVEALKRVEVAHGLVRAELRTLLGAMLEMLNVPSGVVRESLKNRRLIEDLHRITSAAAEANAVAAPGITSAAAEANAVAAPDVSADFEVEIEETEEEHLPAPRASQLTGRITEWTAHSHGE